MNIMEETRKIYTAGNDDGGKLRCPNCGEMLDPADLEAFHRCSFCNWKFEDSEQLDDFILSPVVQNWMGNCQRNFPGE